MMTVMAAVVMMTIMRVTIDSANGETYSLEGHMQMLSLTSGQHYGVTYIYDYRPQLERSTSTNIGLSTYHRDDYDEILYLITIQ